jgi:DNA-binding transcriptional LysR family regulator
MMPTLSYLLAAPVAYRVAKELPGVCLRIVEGYTGHLIDWLHRGEVDISLLYGPGAELHMRVAELFFEELVLLGPKESELKPDKPIRVEQLGKLKLVLPSRPHGLRSAVEAAADKARIKLNVQFEADSFGVLKDLVGMGLGFTVLPLSAVHREGELKRFGYSRLINPKVNATHRSWPAFEPVRHQGDLSGQGAAARRDRGHHPIRKMAGLSVSKSPLAHIAAETLLAAQHPPGVAKSLETWHLFRIRTDVSLQSGGATIIMFGTPYLSTSE